MSTDWARVHWGGRGYSGYPGIAPQAAQGTVGPSHQLVAPCSLEQVREFFTKAEQPTLHPKILFLSYELGPFADPAIGAHPVEPGTVLAEWMAWFPEDSFPAPISTHTPTIVSADEGDSGCLTEAILTPKSTYIRQVEELKRGMDSGDFYEANLTTRFRFFSTIQPEHLGERLFSELRPTQGIMVFRPSEAIISASPELFLRKQGRLLVTRPIKGSARRDADMKRDQHQANSLVVCPKNEAEHLMVVDLARNDLGRLAKPGTVRVVDYKSLETHAAVHHLVSTISAELEQDVSLWQVLQATWPAASITGCPKVAVTKRLAELEPNPRGYYTGGLGVLWPSGDWEINVAIRTCHGVLQGDGSWLYEVGSGGAIVADSDPEGEWDECLMKIRPLYQRLKNPLSSEQNGIHPRGEFNPGLDWPNRCSDNHPTINPQQVPL